MVELILILLLISILAVFVLPKVFESPDVAAKVYQSRLVSILRNLQTRAMQDTRGGYCFRMIFDNANDQFGSTELNYSDGGSASCSSSINTSYNSDNYYTGSGELAAEFVNLEARNASGALISQIDFNGLGIATPNIGSCAVDGVGCYIDLIGATQERVCIEPEGYIHAGNCKQQ